MAAYDCHAHEIKNRELKFFLLNIVNFELLLYVSWEDLFGIAREGTMNEFELHLLFLPLPNKILPTVNETIIKEQVPVIFRPLLLNIIFKNTCCQKNFTPKIL